MVRIFLCNFAIDILPRLKAVGFLGKFSIKTKRKNMKREFDDIKTPADESFEWYFINWLKSSGIAFTIAGLLLVLEICADCIDIKLVLGVFAFVWFGLLCLFVFRAFLGWLVAFVCGMDIE